MEQYEYLILSSIPGMVIMSGLNIFFLPPLKEIYYLDISKEQERNWKYKGNSRSENATYNMKTVQSN